MPDSAGAGPAFSHPHLSGPTTRKAGTVSRIWERQHRAALVVFGDNPEREFPDAWIQCGRFGGTDKSVIADSVECHGVLTEITDEAFEFIRKHTLYGATITGLKRKDTTNIPLRAARELLVRVTPSCAIA